MESGWNLWVWLLGVVVRRYIDFLILLIPTPLVSVLFCSSIPTFCSLKKKFFLYDNCGEWVECMGVASGCGEQEVGVASGSGWNLWVWLLGVVVRRYIDFLILLIPTVLLLYLFFFAAAALLFVHFLKCFLLLVLTVGVLVELAKKKNKYLPWHK